jgi:hypothetical protein
MTMDRAVLIILGDKLLFALDVLAVIESHQTHFKTRNPRWLSTKKVLAWVASLLGNKRSYFSADMLYDAFFHIRRLLKAPHNEPDISEMTFNILPILFCVNGDREITGFAMLSSFSPLSWRTASTKLT